MSPKKAPNEWRNRIVGLTYEDPESLLAHPQNPKIHPEHQQRALRAALGELGWIGTVIQNDTTGYLIDGHDRVANAISTSQPTVPVLHVNLSPDEEALALATFDPIGMMAVNDQAMMDELLREINVESKELGDFLDTLKSEQPKMLNDDTADLTPPAEPITKPGDLWIMGGYTVCPKCQHHNEVGGQK